MYRRVLVPLDGSPVAEAIIPFVLEIAGPLDMEVALLEVVEPPPPMVVEGATYAVVGDVEAQRLGAHEYLAPVAVELRATGVRVTTQVRLGRAQSEILAAAEDA